MLQLFCVTIEKAFLESLGFTKFVMGEDFDNSFDAVIECVGSNSSISNSIKLVKIKRFNSFVGNPESDVFS